MLAGNKEYLLRFGTFQHLVERIVLGSFGSVAQVACMNNEVGLLGQSVDLVDGRLQGGRYIGIRRLIKPHVTVADLDEVEFSLRLLHVLAKRLRRQNAAAERPENAGACPSHAIQKPAAVNAIGVVVVSDYFRQVY